MANRRRGTDGRGCVIPLQRLWLVARREALLVRAGLDLCFETLSGCVWCRRMLPTIRHLNGIARGFSWRREGSGLAIGGNRELGVDGCYAFADGSAKVFGEIFEIFGWRWESWLRNDQWCDSERCMRHYVICARAVERVRIGSKLKLV